MILQDDRFFLEIIPGDSVYFALLDGQGNHFDSSHILWDDLLYPDKAIESHKMLEHELTMAYRLWEIQQTGGDLTAEVVENLVKGFVARISTHIQ